jgi:hypothetical protein
MRVLPRLQEFARYLRFPTEKLYADPSGDAYRCGGAGDGGCGGLCSASKSSKQRGIVETIFLGKLGILATDVGGRRSLEGQWQGVGWGDPS